jgi:hypothetical protein
VAHVRAVRQVVGAEHPHEELVEERRLVAGAARGVEDRLVGRAERPQLAGDQAEGVLPRDRLVVGRPRREEHRPREPPLGFEPVVRLFEQAGHRPFAEEVGRHAPGGRLRRDGLGPVLAKLGMGAVTDIGLGPGTAGAVKAVRLVDLEEGRDAPEDAHLVHDVLDRARDGAEAGRGVVVGPHVDLRRLDGRGGRLTRRRARDRRRGLADRIGHVVSPFATITGSGRPVPGGCRR